MQAAALHIAAAAWRALKVPQLPQTPWLLLRGSVQGSGRPKHQQKIVKELLPHSKLAHDPMR